MLQEQLSTCCRQLGMLLRALVPHEDTGAPGEPDNFLMRTVRDGVYVLQENLATLSRETLIATAEMEQARAAPRRPVSPGAARAAPCRPVPSYAALCRPCRLCGLVRPCAARARRAGRAERECAGDVCSAGCPVGRLLVPCRLA